MNSSARNAMPTTEKLEGRVLPDAHTPDASGRPVTRIAYCVRDLRHGRRHDAHLVLMHRGCSFLIWENATEASVPSSSPASRRTPRSTPRSCSSVIAPASTDRGTSGSATLKGMPPVSNTCRRNCGACRSNDRPRRTRWLSSSLEDVLDVQLHECASMVTVKTALPQNDVEGSGVSRKTATS